MPGRERDAAPSATRRAAGRSCARPTGANPRARQKPRSAPSGDGSTPARAASAVTIAPPSRRGSGPAKPPAAEALQRLGGNRQVPNPGQTAQAICPRIGGHGGGGESGREGEGLGIELARKVKAEGADAHAQLAQTAPLRPAEAGEVWFHDRPPIDDPPGLRQAPGDPARQSAQPLLRNRPLESRQAGEPAPGFPGDIGRQASGGALTRRPRAQLGQQPHRPD